MATGFVNGHTNGHSNGFHPPTNRLRELSELPPQNIEAEVGVLGAIILDNSVLLGAAVSRLTRDDFVRNTHLIIFDAIRYLESQGHPIDAIGLAVELKRRDQFEEIDGDATLFELVQGVPDVCNAEYYARILREKTVARLHEESAREDINDVRSNSYTLEQLLERARQRTARIEDLADLTDAGFDTRPWPELPDPAMWHGLAGDIVRLISPHTEADPLAILVQLLVGFGSLVGRKPHWNVEATRHGCNLFLCIVGNSSKARKGTSWDHVRRLLGGCDPTWESERVMGGLSSGEGMIWAVRDAVFRREKVQGDARLGGGGYQEIMVDPGVTDKRVLFIETEFGSTLSALSRDGNTLSGHIRQAWDSGALRAVTKNNPARATGAHISIIGHITCEELHRRLTQTDAANGFANRFLWLCAKRSQYLPRGGQIHTVNFADAYRRLNAAVEFATDDFECGDAGRTLHLDQAAGRLWDEVYRSLSEPRPGLLGAVTSRAEAQTMRLASIYALLDQSPQIRLVHLQAGLALWRYCDQSAAYIFGDSMGDPDAEKLLAALREVGQSGLTQTQIRRQVFGGHRSTEKLSAVLSTLARNGLAEQKSVGTGGKPSKVWVAFQESEGAPKAPKAPKGSDDDASPF